MADVKDKYDNTMAVFQGMRRGTSTAAHSTGANKRG
jgi:hypothetical protein